MIDDMRKRRDIDWSDPQQVSEYNRTWRQENASRLRSPKTVARKLELKRVRDLAKRGLDLPGKAALLAAQGSRCYLCGDPLALDDAVVDHDHRCCSAEYTCNFCRRGLSCQLCNKLIGLAHDNPERLRAIADNLELVLAKVTIRLHEKPVQLSLVEDQEAS